MDLIMRSPSAEERNRLRRKLYEKTRFSRLDPRPHRRTRSLGMGGRRRQHSAQVQRLERLLSERLSIHPQHDQRLRKREGDSLQYRQRDRAPDLDQRRYGSGALSAARRHGVDPDESPLHQQHPREDDQRELLPEYR